ncbi:hypothetical protein [Spirochaeta africana]|uniref:TIGR03545 family protein n=1 Tax=Spirochaeta africana (strain ATCC 700263 / DSM 8902 / Z-7692) TaxID=889378 RepID=H9UIK5_SPIAZ|nr:hypothetical protein [Spirochaeta africana]AFG37348.1 hypothetical protein Spiaf_1273 [Spirochaeta africana DSM 8902]
MKREKQLKSQRIPKIARRSYTPKRFQHTLIGRLHLPHDRDFLDSMFILGDDGKRHLKPDPDTKELKRLKKLAKAIKQNRGMLRTGRLILPALVVAGLMIFNLVWKDRLLTEALESGLEYVFQAQADVQGLNLQLLSGSITIEQVTVANQNRPMRNLFQADDLVLEIHLPGLLRRQLAITNMQIGSLAHGGQRSVSGALPRYSETSPEETGTAAAEQSARDPLLDLSLPALSPGSVSAVIQDEFDNLAITRSAREAREAADSLTASWASQQREYREQLDAAQGTAQDVAALRPQDLRSLDEIIAARDELRQASSQVQNLQHELQQPIQEARSEIQQVQQRIAGMQEDYEQDLAMLQSRLADLTDDPGDLLIGIAASFISDAGLSRIQDIRTAYQRIERLQELQQRFAPGTESGGAAPSRGGIDVEFPGQEYPGVLYLGRAFSGFSTGEGQHELSLERLSSSPTRLTEATELKYHFASEESGIQAEGYLPLHRPSEPPIQLAVGYQGLPVDIDHELPGIGRLQLTGTAEMYWDTIMSRDGSVAVEGDIRITAPRLQGASGNQLLLQLLEDAIEQAGSVEVELSALVRQGRISQLHGSTNLDRHLAEGLQQVFNAQRDVLRERLERELQQQLEQQQAELEPYQQRLQEITRQASEFQQEANEYREMIAEAEQQFRDTMGSLEQSRQELEQELQEQAAAAERRAQEETAAAERRAREAAEAAEQRAREEREAAEEAARQRAEEEAQRQMDAIRRDRRLPGF